MMAGRALRGLTVGALSLLVALTAACADGEPPAPRPAEGASIERIVTEDGLTLDARLFRASPDRVAILLHMYPADQSAWYDLAREIQAGGGASVLTLDFRGYGASEGDREVDKIDRDVRAAIAFARERGYRSVALVGASMGGTAAIIVAAEQPLAGVIALSAPLSFRGLDAGAAVAGLQAPLAVLASREDMSAADSLNAFRERAGLDARHAVLYDGTAHGTAMLTAEQGDAVTAHLRALLAEFWEEP